jgi:hypothetical protein
MSSETKIDECECCGYETTIKRFDVNAPGAGAARVEAWYCDLCAGTLASTSVRYGREDSAVLRTICYIGNVLRDEIRRTR